MAKFDFKGMLTQNNQVKELPIDILVPYHNHQFKLYSGERFEDMVDSIRQNGVLNPILVQPIENGAKYEILSGHNRVASAKTIGLEYIPAIIKENLSQEEAEMYVVETNLIQRGFSELSISERAHVLDVQHSKLFSQGKRNDIIAELERLEGNSPSINLGERSRRQSSLDKVGNEYGMSRPTVARLIRVNYLIQPFKDLVDTKKMSLMVAVELSYIPQDGQLMVYDVLKSHDTKIDIRLSKAIRSLFLSNEITTERLEELMLNTKKTATKGNTVRVCLNRDVYLKYFSDDTTKDDIESTLEKALKMYFETIQRNKNM